VSVGVSLPTFSFFLSSLPGIAVRRNGVAKLAYARASMPKLRSHSASTGAQARHFSMDHRIKSGGDDC
jgi:hypothetical protein